MEYLLLWLLFGVIAGIIASKKGEGFLGFVVGLIFGPLGILIAIFSSGNRIPCKFCKERINKEAVVCPHCRKDLKEVPSEPGPNYII